MSWCRHAAKLSERFTSVNRKRLVGVQKKGVTGDITTYRYNMHRRNRRRRGGVPQAQGPDHKGAPRRAGDAVR
jgi:hypothetical protein